MQLKALTTLTILILAVMLFRAGAQSISLGECFTLARNNNLLIKQAGASLKAREYALQAEKQSYLPKIDLLAGYNYLSKPLEVNLQQVKDGILEGSSRQAVNTANEVYKAITGNDLSQNAQNVIYNGGKNILNTFYPDYNPALSKQQYFTAALGVRQPIWLGNKLKTVQDVAAAEVKSGRHNLELANQQVELLIALQYLRIMYLNNILQRQQQIVKSFSRIEHDADEMVKQNLLPPYQRNWASTAVIIARSRLQNQELEKQTALAELNKLLNLPIDTVLTITDTLPYKPVTDLPSFSPEFWTANPAYLAIESKQDLAQASLRGSKSFSLPNIFAIGSLQLYQKDLPLTIPPWLVGVEMQWTIFNGTQTIKRIRASKELLEEAKIAADQTKGLLQTRVRVAQNRLSALQNDIAAMDTARSTAALTTQQVEERMRNRMSTPREVNESLLVEEEITKAYYTAVLGYYLALADYLDATGSASRITAYLK
ncbi:TolC family protein [Pseudoflavitalea rhizosphaerae]|uniref:TolC family protein n=1 Tax=Pseudoflavitalea rhizosphaerae TaxID=1884793 RepID=UPI0019D0FB7F|nr:TolC family protein [Pseudoflavitalea rhizosphaerae]